MNKKNIILIIVCVICAFFVARNFYKLFFPGTPTFDQELVKCRILGDWLNKKNLSSCTLFGEHDTLTTQLEKKGITVDKSIPFNPERRIGEFLKLTTTKGIKCVVFIDFFRPGESVDELKNYLNGGGTIYIRNFNDTHFDNSPLCEVLLEFLKKGKVCVVLQKFPDIDIRGLSNHRKVLAENEFIDESNFAIFDKAYKDYSKRKEEFMKLSPPPSR